MKSSLLFSSLLLMIILIMPASCSKESADAERPSLPVSHRVGKVRIPLPLGTIRGYFGTDFRKFDQQIEKVQAVDSFSNCYFYNPVNKDFNQTNLIRSDTAFIVAIYIMGYPLDSLSPSLPVPTGLGKFVEISLYTFPGSNNNSAVQYTLIDSYGKCISITDMTDDVLTGTFQGILKSSNGERLPVSEGEFKIKIFRKHME